MSGFNDLTADELISEFMDWMHREGKTYSCVAEQAGVSREKVQSWLSCNRGGDFRVPRSTLIRLMLGERLNRAPLMNFDDNVKEPKVTQRIKQVVYNGEFYGGGNFSLMD